MAVSERTRQNLLNWFVFWETAHMLAGFSVGDRVKQTTFGEGEVREIAPSGKDYIFTVAFKTAGTKRLMASAYRLERL